MGCGLAQDDKFIWDAGKDPLLQWYTDVVSQCMASSSEPLVLNQNDDAGVASSNNTDLIRIGDYVHGKMHSDICDGVIHGCSPADPCPICLMEIDSMWSSAWYALQCGSAHQACPDSISIGALMTLTIRTWNAAGLLCGSPSKYAKKIQFMQSLLQDCTVCCVQETHDTGDSAASHLDRMSSDCDFFTSSLSAAAGGVLIAISKSYMSVFSGVEHIHIWRGRIFGVALHHAMATVAFITVHIQAEDGQADIKITMMRALLDFINVHTQWWLFICGDFNFITDYADRTHIQSGNSVGRICSAGRFWMQHFAGFDEFYQGSHTRFPPLGSDVGSSARLDRIYANTPIEAYALYDISTGTVGVVPDREMSDHLPVSSSIRPKRRQCGSIKIPHCVTQDKVFHGLVGDIMDNFSFAGCCWARLSQTKEIFRIAYKQYTWQAKQRGASTAKEQIFWSLQAIRASTLGDLDLLNEALVAFPALGHETFSGALPLTQSHLDIIRETGWGVVQGR